MWDQLNHGASFEDVRELYYDACTLSVMSGIEICDYRVSAYGNVRTN